MLVLVLVLEPRDSSSPSQAPCSLMCRMCLMCLHSCAQHIHVLGSKPSLDGHFLLRKSRRSQRESQTWTPPPPPRRRRTRRRQDKERRRQQRKWWRKWWRRWRRCVSIRPCPQAPTPLRHASLSDRVCETVTHVGVRVSLAPLATRPQTT